ncbi:Short chain dehydrogenase/reductase dmxR8 [Exophiala dermatitidis]
MSQDYNIHPDLGGAVRRFLLQFRSWPRGIPALLSARCAKLILAVRTVSKGEAAKEDIVCSVKDRGDGADAIEVWPLDLASTDSSLSFAERVRTSLHRLDAVIENAGINNFSWKVVEGGWEETIQVNVLNTLLLGLLVLPKLSETKTEDPSSSPHLVIVSSLVHRFTRFKEANAPDIYAELNDKKKFAVADRYNVRKLLEILFVRELVSQLEAQAQSLSSPPTSRISGVVITLVNPGMCVSNLDRGMSLPMQTALSVFRFMLGRSTEVGSRTLVHGACVGPTSHGEYLSECQNEGVENWIYSDVGKGVQKKVFEQTMRVLEQRKPGLAAELGL